jgi:hypothetical protein
LKYLSRGPDSSASRLLLRILNSGGQITKAPNQISIMLNGLRYYSLEVNMDKIIFNIQGYDQEACKLYNITMSIIADKDKILKFSEV